MVLMVIMLGGCGGEKEPEEAEYEASQPVDVTEQQHSEQKAEEEKLNAKRMLVLKDVRIFLNSLKHSLELMKQGGIEAGMKKLAAWIRENRVHVKVDHILTFAWNEFEEGGYICPTYREDGSIDESLVDAFAKAAEILRSESGGK